MNYSKRNPYSNTERNQKSYSRPYGQGNYSRNNDYENYSERNRFYDDNDDEHYDNDYDVYASDRYQDDDDYGFEGNYRNQNSRYSNGRENNPNYGRSSQ
ncbi:MAG TPA: hypothetical protein VLB84_00915, partial [Bacteroidia bacterium]|nr:hypothetical protein [Bacteroidia bacterium]